MKRAGAIALALTIASGALAASPEQIGVFSAWSAHRIANGKQRTCYVYGVPGLSRGKYTKRGPTYLQVTHRVPQGTRDEVSLTAGYEFKPGSDVTFDIDGRKFTLFTRGDGAWTRNAKEDAAVVAAMKAGKSLVVRGVSSHGTETTDTYSLTGFTAAHNAIGKACGIR